MTPTKTYWFCSYHFISENNSAGFGNATMVSASLFFPIKDMTHKLAEGCKKDTKCPTKVSIINFIQLTEEQFKETQPT